MGVYFLQQAFCVFEPSSSVTISGPLAKTGMEANPTAPMANAAAAICRNANFFTRFLFLFSFNSWRRISGPWANNSTTGCSTRLGLLATLQTLVMFKSGKTLPGCDLTAGLLHSQKTRPTGAGAPSDISGSFCRGEFDPGSSRPAHAVAALGLRRTARRLGPICPALRASKRRAPSTSGDLSVVPRRTASLSFRIGAPIEEHSWLRLSHGALGRRLVLH